MRPSFLRTASERKLANASQVHDISERYRSLVASIFEWSGLPAGTPSDLPERALFDIGGFGIKNTEALGNITVAGVGKLRDHYGRVLSWTPEYPEGFGDVTGLLMSETDSPLMETVPLYRQIEPYLEVYSYALNSLGQNAFAMAQPVILEGAMENKVEGQLITWELSTGVLTIPSLASKGVPYKVIDLGVKDWSHSLTSVMDAMDREILTIMGIRNSGTEKASGVTSEETTSIRQQLVLWANSQLKVREDWVVRANAYHGLNISVKIADAYTISDTIPEGADDAQN